MTMNRILAATAATAAAVSVQPEPVTDQSFLPGPLQIEARVGLVGPGIEHPVFQSFSVGLTGLLAGAGGPGRQWNSSSGHLAANRDFHFRTWVDDAGVGQVPEASTALLVAATFVAAGAVCRRSPGRH